MRFVLALSVFLLLALSGCNKTWAPVEDHSIARGSYQVGSDGFYRVERGDSLHAIAFKYGLDWRDIARWNGIGAPYVIHPDQQLRLIPPQAKAEVTTRAAGPTPSARERTVDQPADKPPVKTAASPPAQKPVKQVPAASKPASQGKTVVSTADPSKWLWPTRGRILSTFKAGDPARNGIEIAGEEGQAIVAGAAGEVVYSGSGLIGYGELIIIKHSDRLLSAYAHNRKRLVAEGQAVSAGEKIAEMGRDDRNRTMLHFEIRSNGSPQDPQKFLPKQ